MLPLGSFFIFMLFFGENDQKVGAHTLGLTHPCLGNPGSATALIPGWTSSDVWFGFQSHGVFYHLSAVDSSSAIPAELLVVNVFCT